MTIPAISTRSCRECKWHKTIKRTWLVGSTDVCTHPAMAHPVMGSPALCKSARGTLIPASGKRCGGPGVLWEAKDTAGFKIPSERSS